MTSSDIVKCICDELGVKYIDSDGFSYKDSYFVISIIDEYVSVMHSSMAGTYSDKFSINGNFMVGIKNFVDNISDNFKSNV